MAPTTILKLFATGDFGLKIQVQGFWTCYTMSTWNSTKHRGKDELDFIFYPDFIFISWESFLNFVVHSMMNQTLHFETNFPKLENSS